MNDRRIDDLVDEAILTGVRNPQLTTWHVTDNGETRDVVVEIPVSKDSDEAWRRFNAATEQMRRMYTAYRRTIPNG